jgi:hypothetical protein
VLLEISLVVDSEDGDDVPFGIWGWSQPTEAVIKWIQEETVCFQDSFKEKFLPHIYQIKCKLQYNF